MLYGSCSILLFLFIFCGITNFSIGNLSLVVEEEDATVEDYSVSDVDDTSQSVGFDCEVYFFWLNVGRITL
jgi:hypothetical protein